MPQTGVAPDIDHHCPDPVLPYASLSEVSAGAVSMWLFASRVPLQTRMELFLYNYVYLLMVEAGSWREVRGQSGRKYLYPRPTCLVQNGTATSAHEWLNKIKLTHAMQVQSA